MTTRRSALVAGAFAALLLVIGASATAVWWNARTAQADIGAMHDEHLRVNAALASIRADIYLTSILTRDYLLDGDAPVADPQYLRQFTVARENTERNFALLEPMLESEEQRSALARLQQQIRYEYWEQAGEALAGTPEMKRAGLDKLLVGLAKGRQEVFALSGEVENLIAATFQQQQQRATQAAQDFRSSFAWIMLVALLLGLGISGVALLRMNRLERQSNAAESELRRLSGQIRMTQEVERKNLSRELHDEVGQLLTALRMELGGMKHLNNQDAELMLRLENSKRTVEQLIQSIRNIALLLRPSMLDDLGLSAALGWLVKQSSRSSEIDIQVLLDPAADQLPEAHRTCLYRVVQEALTNMARHSGARKGDVVVRASGGWVTVTLTDDGRGFETASGKERGLGLIGMEERVKELGGAIGVTSSPGRGTRIEARLPWPADTKETHAESIDRGRPRDRADGLKASA